MSTVISPLYYLPPIHVMATYLQSAEVIFEAHENYQKGSFRNKCQIGTAQGPITLSIPLRRGKHQAQDIQSVLISNEEDWKTQHWRSIKTAYSNTPYFEHYDYLFKGIYIKDVELLWEFNRSMLKVVQQCIGTKIDFQLSNDYQKDYGVDVVDFRKTKRPLRQIPEYPQVHEEAIPFQSDMSILDLIFHLGPEAQGYLRQC